METVGNHFFHVFPQKNALEKRRKRLYNSRKSFETDWANCTFSLKGR